jgi:hypothetical protein
MRSVSSRNFRISFLHPDDRREEIPLYNQNPSGNAGAGIRRAAPG